VVLVEFPPPPPAAQHCELTVLVLPGAVHWYVPPAVFLASVAGLDIVQVTTTALLDETTTA
jgi:hypothetical protein